MYHDLMTTIANFLFWLGILEILLYSFAMSNVHNAQVAYRGYAFTTLIFIAAAVAKYLST